MKRLTSLLSVLIWLAACANSQNSEPNTFRLVGGPCQGCEAIFEYGARPLRAVDTLPDFPEIGPRIKVSGTVYLPDGSTPAKDVILYVYHTDQGGIYSPRAEVEGWGKQHGYIRAWLKTNAEGQYAFFTLLPGVYPSRTEAAHIHLTVLEPNGKYYWLSSYYFEGDSLLTEEKIHPMEPRGGSSGILNLKKEGELWVGTRDIFLGKHIPGYD